MLSHWFNPTLNRTPSLLFQKQTLHPLGHLRGNNFFWLTILQSRRQSNRLRGAKHLSGGRGSKFKIKHKSRCLQKSKLVDWGGGASLSIGEPGPPWRRPCHFGTGPAILAPSEQVIIGKCAVDILTIENAIPLLE